MTDLTILSMKQITICADDYAYSPEISAGIRDLISAGRLSATSVMANSPYWPAEAPALRELKSECKIGLHFDLIDQSSPLGKWIFLSLFGRIDKDYIKRKLNQQLELFEQHMGCLPDYIDSHQHTHTFPQIRTAFLDTLSEIYPMRDITVRSIHNLISPTQSPIKQAVVSRLSSGFGDESSDFPTNPAFAGLYSLSPKADFARLFEQWIQRSPAETLIMVHPGRESSSKLDPIARTRSQEWHYLLSQQHQDMMANHAALIA